MPLNMQVFNSQRITGVYQGLQDPRTLPQALKFSQRIKERPADEGEIMARFIGYTQIADLVADDQKAGVYSAGKFQFESTNVPNLKVGANMTQAMINQLRAIRNNAGLNASPLNIFDNYESELIMSLKRGVQWRKEALLIGMATDGYSYDRLGIKLINATWGMPSDLKVTSGYAWTDTVNATPVNDLLTMKLVAQVRYGITYDRVTMSTPAFRLMIATAEFQAKARIQPILNFGNLTYANLVQANLEQQMGIAEAVLGMRIELYDARYTIQNEVGEIQFLPLLPLNYVVLSSSATDNDTSVMDFANGVVTESIVAELLGESTISGGPQFGPIAYATGDDDLNPPQITYWAVQRGFPRKHLLQATARLDIGTVVDTISTAAPF